MRSTAFKTQTCSRPFFDKVMVMVDDERVRANRLALLQSLLKEFSTIADFSEIVTEGKESKESSKH
jgi:glycyl-tRNA synthetase beta subunit